MNLLLHVPIITTAGRDKNGDASAQGYFNHESPHHNVRILPVY